MTRRILSGIQPTGNLHLGNYLGAIQQWVPLQQVAECIFFIVDSHAITVPQDPKQLQANIRRTAATYLACGIDPERSIIFAQSSVPAHAELAWIFNCITPLGWLQRMTQFKEKSASQKEGACLGLLAYPVLQAADILLYHPQAVPVGEDQKQHLELTRDIALLFNRLVGHDYFALPEPLITAQGARIMSLRDGTKKMSKSDSSEASRIELTDTADAIAHKVRRAKSDADLIHAEHIENRPELANLLAILALLTGQTLDQTIEPYIGKGFSALKEALIEALVSIIIPIGEKTEALQQDAAYLDAILIKGQKAANVIAHATLMDVKERMGLWVKP